MKKERKSLEIVIFEILARPETACSSVKMSVAKAIASAVREWHREEMNKALGSCMCMDCGKTFKTIDQSKHEKECKKPHPAQYDEVSKARRLEIEKYRSKRIFNAR